MENSLLKQFIQYILDQLDLSFTGSGCTSESVKVGLKKSGGKPDFSTISFRNLKTGTGIFTVIGLLSLQSCTTVKEYEKNKLNDAEMVLGNRTIEKTELNFQSYREGSSGANAGKVGGGCGCN